MTFPVRRLHTGEQTIDLEMLEKPPQDDAFQQLRDYRRIGDGSVILSIGIVETDLFE